MPLFRGIFFVLNRWDLDHKSYDLSNIISMNFNELPLKMSSFTVYLDSISL